MATITFLGTGHGGGAPGRFQSSILLHTDGARILLDAGEPCTYSLLSRGFALDDLDAVWITHAHCDHTAGIPMLLQASKIRRRSRALPLGLPTHLVEPLKAWLRASFLPIEHLKFPLDIFTWKAGEAVTFQGTSVIPRHTSHLDRYQDELQDKSIESFSFEIQTEGKRVVYTGDIGGAKDLEPLLTEPVDLLICELAHLSLADLLAALASSKVGTLCLTHVVERDGLDRAGIRLQCSQRLDQVDSVYLPDDGEQIEF